MKLKYTVPFIYIASLALTSCSSYFTHSSESSNNMLGLHYFLPRGYVLVSGSYVKQKTESGGAETSFVVTVSQIRIRDESSPQFARISENVMYDEDSDIQVKDGLLSSASAKPDDKTADIIKTIVQAGIDSLKSFQFDKPPAPKNEYEPFSIKFDPFDSTQRNDASRALMGKGWKMEPSNSKNAVSLPPANIPKPGLAYRRPYPMSIFLEPTGSHVLPAGGKLVYSQQTNLILPDPSTLAHIPLKRGFMTKRETNIVFVEGEPTRVQLKAPSPVLGAVKLPTDIVKMVGDALPAIVKAQTAPAPPSTLDNLKAENAILEQQVLKLEREKKIRELGGE